jgi:hypothetical protein
MMGIAKEVEALNQAYNEAWLKRQN